MSKCLHSLTVLFCFVFLQIHNRVDSLYQFTYYMLSSIGLDYWDWRKTNLVHQESEHFPFSTVWWSRRMCAHLLLIELQNYNLLLNNHQQENVESHQKSIPHVQGQRRSHSKMVGGAKLHLESNPIPARDFWRAQTKPCAPQGTPQSLSQTCLWVFECLLWRYGLAVACCRGKGSGCYRPGYGKSPLGGDCN